MRYCSTRVCLGLMAAMCGGMSAVGQTGRPVNASVAEQYLFAAANMERTARGLPELRWDEALRRAAAYHAQQMAEHGQISHQYAGEPELTARGAAAGAKFSRIAENVAQASTAVVIHDLWMHSEGHRDNLLDPAVDSVGIAVVSRGRELFAVEDFDRSVRTMSLDEQERAIGAQLRPFGLRVSEGSEEARQTCAMETGYAGMKPWFVMRFTASDVNQIPEQLKERIRSGKYHKAEIGACQTKAKENFSAYQLAVLLYP